MQGGGVLDRVGHGLRPRRDQGRHAGATRGHAGQADAGAQGAFGAQAHGTAHAFLAADAQHVAMLALVRIGVPRRQPARQLLRAAQPGGRGEFIERADLQVQAIEQHLAVEVAGHARVQAPLGRHEAQGHRCAHRGAGGMAGVRVQARRHVQRQHRHPRGIDALDHGLRRIRRRPGQPDAVERIHPGFAIGQHAVEAGDAAAGGPPVGQRLPGLRAARPGARRRHHAHLQAGRTGQPRHHVAVAAVVARPAGHAEVPQPGPALLQQPPGGGTGTAHQLVGRHAQRAGREFVHGPHLG